MGEWTELHGLAPALLYILFTCFGLPMHAGRR